MCRKDLLINSFFSSPSPLRGVIFILMLCMFGLWTQAVYAQKPDSTASVVPPRSHVNDSVTTKKDYKIDITYQGLGFVAAGLLIKSRQHDFREMRNLFQKITMNHGIIIHNMLRSWPLGDFMQRVLKDKAHGNV